METEALSIRGLEKSFPAFHLGPIDLTVPRGAIYGFIGPNGAGKSTTLDLVMGMGAKKAGTVRVFGMDHVEEEAEVKRRVGYFSPDTQ
jgi:ABC-2 type transport system ATP-binding protein